MFRTTLFGALAGLALMLCNPAFAQGTFGTAAEARCGCAAFTSSGITIYDP
jgi:hypothetical protein